MHIYNTKTKLFIFITWVIDLLWFLMAGSMAMMTPMIFDAPGSTELIGPWLFLILILSFPILTLVFMVLSILAYRRKAAVKKILMFSCAPLIYGLLVMLSLHVLAMI